MKYKLAFKFTIQMVIMVAIIAASFYVLISMQTRELEKTVLNKAKISALILGTHLDRIITDNLLAYKDLQDSVSFLIKTESRVHGLKVISPEGVILASSASQELWQMAEARSLNNTKEVLTQRSPKTIYQSRLGKEFITHFMPLFAQAANAAEIIGVLEVLVEFPSQQGQVMTSLRSNRSAYFKQEASDFASRLAGDLQHFINAIEVNRNYLEDLIVNMIADEEIEDIKLFSKDLGILASGQNDRKLWFSAAADNPLYQQVIERKETVTHRLAGSSHLLEILSPLYLVKNNQKEVAGVVAVIVSRSQIEAAIAAARNNIIMMSLIIIIAFILLIGSFFRRNILKPISELTRSAVNISQGDFTRRVHVRSHDEVAGLAQVFNAMCDELQKSKREIESYNLKLQENIERVTKELEEKQAQLLQSEKLASLGILSSGIAHEINNPIGIILGHTQMLLKELRSKVGLKNPKEVEKLLVSIEEHTKRCSNVIKSLLQFARSKELKFEEVDIHATIAKAIGFLEERLKRKAIIINKNFSNDLPFLRGDSLQLEQVFINLLLNAEQSIEKEGVITIETTLVRGMEKPFVTVTFKDTGKGISKEASKKVFDPFFSTKDPGEGAGLGLSLSYGIIKAHKGDIEIKSKENKGTTVIVRLPL